MSFLRLMLHDIFHTIDRNEEGHFKLPNCTIDCNSIIKELPPCYLLDNELQKLTLELKGLDGLELMISLRNHKTYHAIISRILTNLVLVAINNMNTSCYHMIKYLLICISNRQISNTCVSEKKTHNLVRSACRDAGKFIKIEKY